MVWFGLVFFFHFLFGQRFETEPNQRNTVRFKCRILKTTGLIKLDRYYSKYTCVTFPFVVSQNVQTVSQRILPLVTILSSLKHYFPILTLNFHLIIFLSSIASSSSSLPIPALISQFSQKSKSRKPARILHLSQSLIESRSETTSQLSSQLSSQLLVLIESKPSHSL